MPRVKKKILNVLYQSDDNYAVVSAISIASLLENNKTLDEIHIFYCGYKPVSYTHLTLPTSDLV